MTTNPTPLTAEDVAYRIWGTKQRALHPALTGLSDIESIEALVAQEVAKAYAAQQNAELVAEVERLKIATFKASNAFYDVQTENKKLQAGNERLKQENAKLAGQIVRLEADYKQAAEEVKVLKGELAQAELKASQRGKAWIELSSQNERLKQHNKALIPLAAWAKTHGHELTCAIRKPMPEGVDRVVCTCGWVNAHNHSGLTTNQHIELAKYSEAQPPKEAT